MENLANTLETNNPQFTPKGIPSVDESKLNMPEELRELCTEALGVKVVEMPLTTDDMSEG